MADFSSDIATTKSRLESGELRLPQERSVFGPPSRTASLAAEASEVLERRKPSAYLSIRNAGRLLLADALAAVPENLYQVTERYIGSFSSKIGHNYIGAYGYCAADLARHAGADFELVKLDKYSPALRFTAEGVSDARLNRLARALVRREANSHVVLPLDHSELTDSWGAKFRQVIEGDESRLTTMVILSPNDFVKLATGAGSSFSMRHEVDHFKTAAGARRSTSNLDNVRVSAVSIDHGPTHNRFPHPEWNRFLPLGENSAYNHSSPSDELGAWRQNFRHAMRQLIAAGNGDEEQYNSAASHLFYVSGLQASNASYHRFVYAAAIDNIVRGTAEIIDSASFYSDQRSVVFIDDGYKFTIEMPKRVDDRDDRALLRDLRILTERSTAALAPAQLIAERLLKYEDELPIGGPSGAGTERLQRAIAAYEESVLDDSRWVEQYLPVHEQIQSAFSWPDEPTLQTRTKLHLP